MIESFKSIEEIKGYINKLYQDNKEILVSVAGRKKINGVKAKIAFICGNFFCVKSDVNGYIESFTICYRDIYIKKIIIKEN